MAQTLAYSTDRCWENSSASIEEVNSALEKLRKESQYSATRTAVVNLIALANNVHEANLVKKTIRELGSHHPGRTIIITLDQNIVDSSLPKGRFEANVCLFTSQIGGKNYWSEEVSLNIGGTLQHNLNSLVESLLVSDLPIALWRVSGAITLEENLIDVSNVILIDTKDGGDKQSGLYNPSLALISNLFSKKTPVVDLSWIRLTIWRQLFAGLFNSSEFRDFLNDIEQVNICGKEGPRRLLGGWIVHSLDLDPDKVSLTDAKHASIQLIGKSGKKVGNFTVKRHPGTRVVQAQGEIQEGPCATQLATLPKLSLPWSLNEALINPGPDPIFQGSVLGALKIRDTK